MKKLSQQIDYRVISSLEKVFPDEELKAEKCSVGSAMRKETYSFQVAFCNRGPLLRNLKAEVFCEKLEKVIIRSVGLVPSELPCYSDCDDNVLRTTPGLYPDPLYPENEVTIAAITNQWRSLWITAEVPEDACEGTHQIEVRLSTEKDECVFLVKHSLTVIPYTLQNQKLLRTEWFHTDCLADFYQVEVFGEAYWKWVRIYVKNAVSNGINMIYTPLFTPPLDTEPGGERPTVQLVEVKKDGGGYHFCFEKLDRWIRLCQEEGITHFEMSHLFTQWGAAYSPKIIIEENGEKMARFGWHVSSDDPSYKEFLQSFLPALLDYLTEKEIGDRVYFHVSDEPDREHFNSYKKASNILKGPLENYPIIDALSDPYFFDKGIIENPIPASDCIEPFHTRELKERWVYYCCKQDKKVSNRFMHMPSARNRIIGIQLYEAKLDGFLHWGYNFWYSRFSKEKINPFFCTDADRGFPSGDAFLVYPGKKGPIESIRMVIFKEGLQDLRALETLEQLIGRQKVLDFIKTSAGQLTFTDYPKESKWLLEFRSALHKKIIENQKVLTKEVKS